MLIFLLFFYPLISFSSESIILIGDTGYSNSSLSNNTTAIKNVCKQHHCRYGVLLGDNVYGDILDNNFSKRMDLLFASNFSKTGLKYYAILGNHDYDDDIKNKVIAEYQLKYSKLNKNFIMPSFFYFIEFKNHISVFLDTTQILFNKLIKEQEVLLTKVYKLAKKKNKTVLVFGHHNYLGNGTHGNAGMYEGLKKPDHISGKTIKTFVEKNICSKAAVYISGHEHLLSLYEPPFADCNTYFLISGSGSDSDKIQNNNSFIFNSNRSGFFVMSIDENKISVFAYDEKGTPLFNKLLL